MGRQGLTLKWAAIGGDVLLEIPRNHLEWANVSPLEASKVVENFLQCVNYYSACGKPWERVSPILITLTSRNDSNFEQSNISLQENKWNGVDLNSTGPTAAFETRFERTKEKYYGFQQTVFINRACISYELARSVRKDRGLNTLQYEKQTRLINC